MNRSRFGRLELASNGLGLARLPRERHTAVGGREREGHHQTGLHDAAHAHLAAEKAGSRFVFQTTEVRLNCGTAPPLRRCSPRLR